LTDLTVLLKIGLLCIYLSAVFFRVSLELSIRVFYYVIFGEAQYSNFDGRFCIAFGRILGTFKRPLES
jgi:hypothetical protein